MDTAKLIPLGKRIQIITAVEKASPYGGEIWQSGSEGRQILKIIQIQVDVKSDKIILKTYGFDQIDQSAQLFVRFCYRNIIFRLNSSEYKIMGDKLVCEYPQEARGLQERSSDRYVLPFSSDISLTIKRAERTMRETVLDLEVRIMDVSEKGFGIIISGPNRDFLNRADHFWIKAIDQRPLPHHMYGTVTYVAPKGYYLKRGDVRVGLSLVNPLSRETFEYLKKKSHLVLTA